MAFAERITAHKTPLNSGDLSGVFLFLFELFGNSEGLGFMQQAMVVFGVIVFQTFCIAAAISNESMNVAKVFLIGFCIADIFSFSIYMAFRFQAG